MLACPYFKKLNKAIGRKYQEWDTDIVLREFRGQMNFTGIIRKDMCSRQKVNLALKEKDLENAKKKKEWKLLLIDFFIHNIF